MKKTLSFVFAAMAGIIALTGCGESVESSGERTEASPLSEQQNGQALPDKQSWEQEYFGGNQGSASISGDVMITGSGIEYNDGRLTISQGGVYNLSGNITGKIYVKTGEDENTLLKLSGLSVSNESGPALYHEGGGLCIAMEKDTENYFNSKGSKVGKTLAAIYSNGTIAIWGEGEIAVESAGEDAISGREILLEGGNVRVNSSENGISSTDGVKIKGGRLLIHAEKKGITISGNSKSEMLISGGETVINASLDGVSAEEIAIDNGTVIINCPDEDGSSPLVFEKNGLKVNGGILAATGGTLYAPSEGSTQNSLLLKLNPTVPENTLIAAVDQEGEEKLIFQSRMPIARLLFSSPELDKGSTLSVYTGGHADGVESNGLFIGDSIYYSDNNALFTAIINGTVTEAGGTVDS